MSIEIGQNFSHYQILEKLGEGGMGIVYKAFDTSLNRNVALKFLPSNLIKDESTRERFIVEAQAASALDHPNICNIHEINETEDGQLYICMAYYEGESLRQKIKKGPLSVEESLNIFYQITQGLKVAHDEKIIHRDIKPGNIIITEKGKAKIVDFGLAKLAGEKLTESISTKGTIAYMAPEVIRSLPEDNRADIWSLGVVLYEMLTGHLPFKGEYPEPLMYSILNEEPKSLSQYLNNVPELLQEVIDKLLKKDPRERYQNSHELLMDLEKLKPGLGKNDKTGFARVITRKSKRILSQRIVIPVVILLILFTGFLYLKNSIFYPSVLKPKPIAIISFENQTGEEEYDYLQKAIPNLLISRLEQSGNLRVATWERLHDLLKQKGKQDIEIIDPDLGFEICQLDGIETIVLGSYTKAGEVFALDIKVLDVKSKELMQSASSHGHGISSILTNQIDELSDNIFRELGVLEKTSKPTRPISDVTTISMEAYNYFIRGREEWEKRNIKSSRQFLEKAIKLDTTFAIAYYYLARVYYWLQDHRTEREALQKARNYLNNATEKEKLYIEAGFAESEGNNSEIRFDLLQKITEKYPQEKRAHLDIAYWYYTRNQLYDQALERYNKAIELDPNFGLAFNLLGFTYMYMGEYEKAIQNFKRYSSLNPGDANTFDSMGELYLRMGELDQALAKYKEATEVEPSFFYSYRCVAYIYALKEDYTQTMKWIDQYIKIAPSDGIRRSGHLYKGFYCFWLGSLEKSQQELQVAADFNKIVDNGPGLANINWARGWIYFYMGDMINGRKHFSNWFESRIHHYPQNPSYKAEFSFYFGLKDVKEDNLDSAKSRLEEMHALLPEIDVKNMVRISYYYDVLKAELLFAQDSFDKVINISEEISPLQMPPVYPGNFVSYNLPFPLLRDFLARAYHHNGYLNKAISEYEKLITFDPKSKDRRLIHPTYYFKLAKLYEEKGESDKAIENYQKFLEIWKNADEELPEVVDAKNRSDKLKNKN